MIQPKKSHPVLDALINGVTVRNDSDIARMLGVGTPVISEIRTGKRPLGDSTRVKIMRVFLLSIWDIDELEAVDL